MKFEAKQIEIFSLVLKKKKNEQRKTRFLPRKVRVPFMLQDIFYEGNQNSSGSFHAARFSKEFTKNIL